MACSVITDFSAVDGSLTDVRGAIDKISTLPHSRLKTRMADVAAAVWLAFWRVKCGNGDLATFISAQLALRMMLDEVNEADHV